MDNALTYTTVSTVVHKPNVTKTNGFIKSRQRTSFKEFVIRKKLRPEVRAGFKVWLKGQLHHFDDEWEHKFNEYVNRKI